MVDLSGEANLWGLEGVVCREGDAQKENTVGVGTVSRAHDGSLPVEEIVTHGAGRAGGRRITGAKR